MPDPSKQTQLMTYLQSKKEALKLAVPESLRQSLTIQSIIQGLGLAIAKNPKLAECDSYSVYVSTLFILRLGLDPSGQTGQAWLVPYDGKASPLIGYQGKLELAYRSGNFDRFSVQVVKEKDDFVFDLATCTFSHTYKLGVDRGKTIGAYCLAWLKGATTPVPELMDRIDFERIEAAAKKKNRGKLSPAYAEWEDEMFRRSVLTRALKRLPKSADLFEVLAHENEEYREGAIDTEFEEVPETKAIDEKAPPEDLNPKAKEPAMREPGDDTGEEGGPY